MNANDGTLLNTRDYSAHQGGFAYQIAEIKPNILVTADQSTALFHNITNIHNIYTSKIFDYDIEDSYSVTALEINPGDYVIGGREKNNNQGFI